MTRPKQSCALPVPNFKAMSREARRAPTRRKAYNNKYTEERANYVLRGLMSGKSLRSICTEPMAPTLSVVLDWTLHPDHTDFSERYYYARRIQAEMRVDELFDILDTDRERDWEIVADKNGNPKVQTNMDHIQRVRMRTDAIKWYASKMLPKLYGQHVQQNHEVVGDLKKLLTTASNQQAGLPEAVPIEGDFEDITDV